MRMITRLFLMALEHLAVFFVVWVMASVTRIKSVGTNITGSLGEDAIVAAITTAALFYLYRL